MPKSSLAWNFSRRFLLHDRIQIALTLFPLPQGEGIGERKSDGGRLELQQISLGKFGMTTEGIKFVDTTIRDGHQSLWAENMTTGMMLPVAEAMDRSGFDAIELISSSHLKKCVRELKEDPWARVKLMSQRITHTPLRLNAGRFSAFDLTPRSMYRLFMERMAANGIREARISEEWNELEGWTWKTQVSRDVGINPVPNIIYSVSPKHSDEYFARRTRDAASLKVNRLCLKDPGGLLTPERVKTLVPIMFQNANGI